MSEASKNDPAAASDAGGSGPAGAKPGPKTRSKPRRRRKTSSPAVRTLARWMFHGHLWVGVIVTFLVISLSVTGIMLNHKRFLGFMPDAEGPGAAAFDASLSLPRLVEIANGAVSAPVVAAGVDRMDVRPDDGLVKIRFADDEVTEVTLALDDGEVLAVGLRNDVFIEKLHSGEIFGDGWILLSDFGGVALLVLLMSGFWMWLYPRARAR